MLTAEDMELIPASVNNTSRDQPLHPSIRTSSGTALMLVKPLLKQTYTLLAPQRRAEVAQSNAVSPAPKTITTPLSTGRAELHWHIPGQRSRKIKNVNTYCQILSL